jgi:sodium-dependent lysophosphatidylcholine symporter 1
MQDRHEITYTVKYHSKKLSLLSKICFASVGTPQQLTNTAFAVFSTKYMLDVARLPAHYTSIILLTSLIAGGLSNPLFAYFVNKSPITKYGKMKPWILALSPICCLSYILIWYVPAGLTAKQLMFWILFFICIYQISLTGFRLPHTSMTMYLSDCERERDSATIIRMYLEIISLLVAIIAQNLVIGDSSSECDVPLIIGNLTNNDTYRIHDKEKYDINSIIQPNMNIQSRYLLIAIVFSSTFIISQLLLAFGVKERTDLIVETSQNAKSVSNSRTLYHLKCIFSFRPFLIFMLFTVFGNVAVLVS